MTPERRIDIKNKLEKAGQEFSHATQFGDVDALIRAYNLANIAARELLEEIDNLQLDLQQDSAKSE